MKTSCDVTISNSKTYWKILWWKNTASYPLKTKISSSKVAFTHTWIWRNFSKTTQLFPNVFVSLIFRKIHKITGWASMAASENGTRNFYFGNVCHLRQKLEDFSWFWNCWIWRAELLILDWQIWRKNGKVAWIENSILPRIIWAKETTKGNSVLRVQSTSMSALDVIHPQSYP